MVVYTVTCAILGHRTAFSVKIDSNEQVSELKRQIRAEQFQALALFQASDLNLYKINIPVTPTYDAVIEPIYQRTVNVNEDDELKDPTAELEDVFPDGAPRKTIHILVKVPEGESFSSRPGRDVALTTPCNDRP